MRLLAKSQNFAAENEYETVWVVRADGIRTAIGDFYGDPECALIDCEEKWCVVAGEGIVVYWLHEPFNDFRRGGSSRQYQELLRDLEARIYINQLIQTGPNSVMARAENGEAYNILLEAVGYAAIQPQR